jgi:hypothetical protein
MGILQVLFGTKNARSGKKCHPQKFFNPKNAADNITFAPTF